MTTILAAALISQQRLSFPEGRLLLLEPIVARAVVTAEGHRVDPYLAGEPVQDRMHRESKKWEGWSRIDLADRKRTTDAMRAVIGPRGTPIVNFTNLTMVADRAKARYVAYYVLAELTGARTRAAGARTTGRATVDLRVYDVEMRSLVWSAKVTETSTATTSRRAMEPRIEQAHLNALRAALAPVVTQGLMKAVPDEDSLLGVYR